MLSSAAAAGADENNSLNACLLDVENPVSGLKGFGSRLEKSGFSVAEQPFTTAPSALKVDLIVLGSFTNRTAASQAYMRKYASELQAFVEKGGVLLQMAQFEESQRSILFFPAKLTAIRGDAQLDDLRVTDTGAVHPLLKGMPMLDAGKRQLNLQEHLGLKPGWHTFMEQSGCAVLMGAGEGIDNPVFLEASSRKGRFLLTCLFFDRLCEKDGLLTAPRAYADFADVFADNLASYVRLVKSGGSKAAAVTPKPKPLPFKMGSWTLAVLPDTQYYSRKYPEIFEAQTKWIAANAGKYNIKYVLHLGDITADNIESQWVSARRAMSLLDGKVPYALVGGNHDYGPKGNSANRESYINKYFPVSQYVSWPTFGGMMEEGKIDNTYHLFEAGGEKWIVLALEWVPRDEVVDWADQVLRKHADRRAILITHAYLAANDIRYDWGKYGRKQSATPRGYALARLPGGGNDGEDLWRKLVSRHPGMVMTINGHVLQDGVARLSSTGIHGNVVHQMLVNYQRLQPCNGNGYMRLYEFQPDGETVQARSYSPFHDTYKTDFQNQFILKMTKPVK